MQKLICLLFFTTISLTQVSGQEKVQGSLAPATIPITEAISQARIKMNDLLSEYPGLSITVGIGDSIVWSAGFGYADISKKEPVSTNHQFRYYSLSKSITGIALIKLMESGLLDIDESIRHYLPDLPDSYQNVKVKQLIAHTAGIRNYKKGEWMQISQHNCVSARDALGVFINDPLIFEPGSSDAYTSFGYVLLSALIESISGKPFIDYLNQSIFEPLGINSIVLDKSTQLTNEVSYYDKWNAKKQKGSESKGVNNTCKFGAGGLVGTTKDFVTLHLKMLNGQLCSKPFTEIYYSSLKRSDGETVGYAFGIGDKIVSSVKHTYGHSGSGLGGNAIFSVYPYNKLVIAIAGNVETKEMNSKIAEIAQLFLAVQ